MNVQKSQVIPQLPSEVAEKMDEVCLGKRACFVSVVQLLRCVG